MLLIGYVANTQAQDFLSNGSFETWEDMGGYSEPKYWYTLNSLTQFGFEASTIVSETPRSGQKSVLLITTENALQNLPGILASGPILNEDSDVDFSNIKVPFTYRPKAMSFYYKYVPGPMDSCNAYMALTRWNSTRQQTDTIAEAVFSIGDTVAEYRKVEVDFIYYSTQTPDSALVIITSSYNGFDPVVGSALYIDDFGINFNTGLTDLSKATIDVMMYPNPASDFIKLKTQEAVVDVEITNSLGQLVLVKSKHQSNQEIAIATLPIGMYWVKTTSNKGTAINKFIKQ